MPTAADRLIFAVVDPDDAVAEFREDDNAAFQTLAVLGLPDPAVSAGSLRLEPAFPNPGEATTLAVTVSNLGEQRVDGLVVRAFDGDPDLDGVALGDQVITTLAGNGSATVTFTWTPAGGEPRPVVVVLDPDDAVEEASELNNRAQTDLVVQDGDFVVSERYFSPDGDGVQDSTTLLFRLPAPTDAEVRVIDAQRDLVVRRAAFPGTTGDQFTWNGRDDLGRLVRDANYLLRLVDAAGSTLGEATATVDTDRQSLLRVAGTPYEAVTNLTCELPTTSALVSADDESWLYFSISATGDPIYGRGFYRLRPDGSELTQIITAGFLGARVPAGFVIAAGGSKIAFRTTRTNPSRAEVWVANGDGGALVQIGDPAVSSPTIPSGSPPAPRPCWWRATAAG